MSESKHTNGPWFGSREKPVFVPLKAISCERLGFSIGWVNGHREEEAAANARLIAAAPELLELCKRFSAMYGHLWDSADKPGCGWLSMDSVKKYDAIHADMAAVIKKATAT